MKTKTKILKEIKKLEQDERLSYPVANVEVNAPLALIQTGLANKITALKRVLEEGKNA